MDILLVDDDRDCCDDLSKFLERVGFSVTRSYNGMDAFEKVKSRKYDAIISDVNMPVLNGIELVKKINEYKSIVTEIILISGIEEIAQSINAIELGIYDFITKPVDVKKLMQLLDEINSIKKVDKNKDKRIIEDIYDEIKKKDLIKIDDIDIEKSFMSTNSNMENICVFSNEMKSIFKKLDKIHDYPEIPVLLEGMTGTGKEIIAKYIHYESSYNSEPFVAVNCAAINKEMFESELFGYEKGAYTGARPEGRNGFIKIAENGTLFLDEITEINIDTQTKLLRLIQEREYYRVGSSIKERTNARFIFATNVSVESLVKRNLFRSDLYFRLNSCKINIPSLAERKNEIIPLALYFIYNISNKLNKKINNIESEALVKLLDYNWPGNIRELKNIISNILLFSDSDTIKKEDITFESVTIRQRRIKKNNKKNIEQSDILTAKLPDIPFNLDGHIESIIDRALNKFNGNKTKAAEFLGISRMQLYNRYKK